ncbi:hypothetical protein OHA91_00630 [Streptomyces erythrochromogenes]|uniref:YbbR-like domain-containing protein n=1 Tax=Streptomyces erythrochromogenes TaxID=285574 RepID=A0ABZ1Q357_9ACTN|nr:hypothetical protein [Streptomyces erythrochromogenes]
MYWPILNAPPPGRTPKPTPTPPPAPTTPGNISVGTLSAERLRVEDGVAAATGVRLEALRYERPGVRIDMERASVPRASVVVPDLSYVQIPELDLAGASLRIDFDALGPSSGASDKVRVTANPMTMLEALHGSASLTVASRGTPLPLLTDPRDITPVPEFGSTTG